MALRDQNERRTSVRVFPKGTLLLLTGDHAQRARISNIGTGGCLATTAVTAPDAMLGCRVDIELRLDGHDAGWLRLAGHVRRIRENTIAVSFDTVPAEFVRVIEAMATARPAPEDE